MELLSEDFGEFISHLFADIETLRKLIYRNNNQHGKTIVFQYIKSLRRQIKPLSEERLKLLQIACRDCVKLTRTKITMESIDKLSITLTILTKLLLSTSKAMFYGLNALKALSTLLAKRVFAALYTILFANISRIIDELSQLILTSFELYQSLIGELTHISHLYPKYHTTIHETLRDIVLPSIVEQSIHLLNTYKGSSLSTKSADISIPTIDYDEDNQNNDSDSESYPNNKATIEPAINQPSGSIQSEDVIEDIDEEDDLGLPVLASTNSNKTTNNLKSTSSTPSKVNLISVSSSKKKKRLSTSSNKDNNNNQEIPSNKKMKKSTNKDDIDDIFNLF